MVIKFGGSTPGQVDRVATRNICVYVYNYDIYIYILYIYDIYIYYK